MCTRRCWKGVRMRLSTLASASCSCWEEEGIHRERMRDDMDDVEADSARGRKRCDDSTGILQAAK